MTTRSKVGIFKPKTHTTNLSYPSHVHSPSTPLDNHECHVHSPFTLSSQSSMHINKSKSFFLSMCVTKPWNIKKALAYLDWKQYMQEEFNALVWNDN